MSFFKSTVYRLFVAEKEQCANDSHEASTARRNWTNQESSRWYCSARRTHKTNEVWHMRMSIIVLWLRDNTGTGQKCKYSSSWQYFSLKTTKVAISSDDLIAFIVRSDPWYPLYPMYSMDPMVPLYNLTLSKEMYFSMSQVLRLFIDGNLFLTTYTLFITIISII